MAETLEFYRKPERGNRSSNWPEITKKEYVQDRIKELEAGVTEQKRSERLAKIEKDMLFLLKQWDLVTPEFDFDECRPIYE